MAITGVVLGGSGTFTEKPNGALQAGSVPAWSSTDTSVTLAPSGDGTSCVVSVAAADVNPSFPLTVTGVNSAGASISTTVTVPILPAPATGFDIEQSA